MKQAMVNTLIGQNVRHHRLVAGLSEVTVAARLRVTVETYCQYEHGSRRLNCNDLIRLAELFDCSVNDLCREDGPDVTPSTTEPPWNPYAATLLLAEFNRIRSRAVRDRVCILVGRIADRYPNKGTADL